jgi:hypothetical protein
MKLAYLLRLELKYKILELSVPNFNPYPTRPYYIEGSTAYRSKGSPSLP